MKSGKFIESLAKSLASLLQKRTQSLSSSSSSDQKEGILLNEIAAAEEQRQFTFETLAAATRNFHPKLKLGEGGFGPVYKGKLEGGKEIAVKKLARGSRQGRKEFANEAMLLARVQHRNVVNLVGYCSHGAEKLLVYEYVANESLDKLLFDDGRRGELDWKRRHEVIVGVARGLLYLHEDSHCRIIHRDIKASNILLDQKWVPKIADFGMARLFPEDQPQVNTRVAGTNGYMAPEYAMHGQLSVKADVFSFGVLVLELISGKRNATFKSEVDSQNLLQWAWKLYKKGQALEIMDPILASKEAADQVLMCLQIGLLCTQADPKLRPTMRRVVIMLSKKPGTLDDEPTRPGYLGARYRRSHWHSSGGLRSHPACTAVGSLSTSNLDTTFTTALIGSPGQPSHHKAPD